MTKPTSATLADVALVASDIRRAALSVRVRKVAVFDFSSDASGRALLDGLVSSPAPQCSGGRWIDFCAPDATKGVALMILADALGVDPTRAAVFGDGENDRSLFAKAGYRFAVAGAHPALMVEATHVVADASHGGVLDGLDAIVQAKESRGAAEGFAIG
ncbi:MAG: HAD hydrolase family protein [Actinomycetaceae bacterium]|nr:HAD hydrolase family protein [Actinomycetaceae bacterium]